MKFMLRIYIFLPSLQPYAAFTLNAISTSNSVQNACPKTCSQIRRSRGMWEELMSNVFQLIAVPSKTQMPLLIFKSSTK